MRSERENDDTSGAVCALRAANNDTYELEPLWLKECLGWPEECTERGSDQASRYARPRGAAAQPPQVRADTAEVRTGCARAVSYTHLTLPTIYSV